MAHLLVASTPFGGHQPPLLGLTAELIRRGHRVTFHTGAKYGGAAERAGATWLPWAEAPDFDDRDLASAFPRVEVARGLSAMFVSFKDVFFGTGPGQLRDLIRLHDHDPVDLAVAETTCVGPAFLHEACGVPWAGFSLSPLALTSRRLPPPGLGIRPGSGPLGPLRDAALRGLVGITLAARMRTLLNDARAEAGLPPTPLGGLDSLHSPLLQLAQGVPGLEPHRPDAPAHLHFVGDAAVGTRTSVEPEWMRALDPTRPIVHVTAGTLDVSGDLPAAAVPALADTPAQVVVSGDPSLVPAAPNVIAPGWVPHDLLLPRTWVVVSNGGYGGVLAALAHGIPLVVAPGGQDKPAVARQVANSGAGLDLRRAAPPPARLRRAVEACVGDSSYRGVAHRLADRFAAAGGARRAADLVEEALAGSPRR